MKKNKKYIIIGFITVIFLSILFLCVNKAEISNSSKEMDISLVVLDKKYNTEIKEGSTVYDVMKKIEDDKKNNFTFKTKEYSGMGHFVNEINGIAGESGKYWMYYVNGSEPAIGISKFTIGEGDIISWEMK